MDFGNPVLQKQTFHHVLEQIILVWLWQTRPRDSMAHFSVTLIPTPVLLDSHGAITDFPSIVPFLVFTVKGWCVTATSAGFFPFFIESNKTRLSVIKYGKE